MKGLFHRLAEQAVGSGSVIVPVGAARFETPPELIESELPGPEGETTWSMTTRSRRQAALSAPNTASQEYGRLSQPAHEHTDSPAPSPGRPTESPWQGESGYQADPSTDPLENPGDEGVASADAAADRDARVDVADRDAIDSHPPSDLRPAAAVEPVQTRRQGAFAGKPAVAQPLHSPQVLSTRPTDVERPAEPRSPAKSASAVGPVEKPAARPAAMERDDMVEDRVTDEWSEAPQHHSPDRPAAPALPPTSSLAQDEFAGERTAGRARPEAVSSGEPGDSAGAPQFLREKADGVVPPVQMRAADVPTPPERHAGSAGDASYDDRPAAPSGDPNPSLAEGFESIPSGSSQVYPVSELGNGDPLRIDPAAVVPSAKSEASPSSRQEMGALGQRSPDVGSREMLPTTPAATPIRGVGATRDQDVGTDHGEQSARVDAPPSETPPSSATPLQGEGGTEVTQGPAERTAERNPLNVDAVPARHDSIEHASALPVGLPSTERPKFEGAVEARDDTTARASAAPARPEFEGDISAHDDSTERASVAPARLSSRKRPETGSRQGDQGADSRPEVGVSRRGPRPTLDGESARPQGGSDRSAARSPDGERASEFAIPERSEFDTGLGPPGESEDREPRFGKLGESVGRRAEQPTSALSVTSRRSVTESTEDPPSVTAAPGPHGAGLPRSRGTEDGLQPAIQRSIDLGEVPAGPGLPRRFDPTVRRKIDSVPGLPTPVGSVEAPPPVRSADAAVRAANGDGDAAPAEGHRRPFLADGRSADGRPRSGRSSRPTGTPKKGGGGPDDAWPETGDRTVPADSSGDLSAVTKTERQTRSVVKAVNAGRTNDGKKEGKAASAETSDNGHRPRSPAEPTVGRLAERLGMGERPGPVRVSIDTIVIDAQSPPAQTRRSPRAAPKVSLEAYARRHKAPDR